MSGSRHRWGVSFIILSLLALLGLKLELWGSRVAEHVQAERAVLTQLNSLRERGLTGVDPTEVINLAYQSSSTLLALKQDLQPLYPLLPHLAGLPRYGPLLQQVEPGLEYGLAVSQLGQSLAAAALPFWQLTQPAPVSGDAINERLYQAYGAAAPFLDQTVVDLARLRQARAAFNPAVFPLEVRQKFDQIDQALPVLDKGLSYAPLVSHLLGVERPFTCLVLVQNRDELRPTGGFITVFGLARIDRGRLTLLDFEDSTAPRLDYVDKVQVPPEPLHQIMMASYWVPRDGNWSPDFPTAARQVQELYYSSTAYPTDGVIAFDQSFLVALSAFLGPLKVSADLPDITAANLIPLTVKYKMDAIAAGEKQNRKDLISRLAPAMLQALLQIRDIQQFQQLFKLVMEQVQGGHILFYANDPALQNSLLQEHLAGQIDPGPADYLLLVDSNVGFSKNDMAIRRSLSYDLDLSDPAAPQAALSLRYEYPQAGTDPCDLHHSRPPSNNYDEPYCYWDYWRVYTPGETQLLKAQFEPVPADYFAEGYSWKNEVDASTGEGGARVWGRINGASSGISASDRFAIGPARHDSLDGCRWAFTL